MVYTMAVDWLASNVYIMDLGLKRLVVCAMETSVCTSVYMPAAGDFNSLALHPRRGQVTFVTALKTRKNFFSRTS